MKGQKVRFNVGNISFDITISVPDESKDEVYVVKNKPVTSNTTHVVTYKIQDLLNTIKNYCKITRSWAAMEEDNRWYRYDKKPILIDNKRWAKSDYSSFCKGLSDFGLVPENVEYGIRPENSLITPNGEWYKDVKKDTKIKRGDPVFVWSDYAEDKIPSVVAYFYSFCNDKNGKNKKIYTYSTRNINCRGAFWDNWRKFDPALVGVPRKDWPKE